MALTPIIVTSGPRTNPDGTIARGRIAFQLNQAMVNGTDIISPDTIVGMLDPVGMLVASDDSSPLILWATDDADTLPTGASYNVTEIIDGSAQFSYSISVPSASPDGTVDLSTLIDF